MADLASFQKKRDDKPQIINLDKVDLVIAEETDTSALILFAKFPGKLSDDSGRPRSWYQQPSNHLMVWEFDLEGKSLDDLKNIRDGILHQVLMGERHIKLYKYSI